MLEQDPTQKKLDNLLSYCQSYIYGLLTTNEFRDIIECFEANNQEGINRILGYADAATRTESIKARLEANQCNPRPTSPE